MVLFSGLLDVGENKSQNTCKLVVISDKNATTENYEFRLMWVDSFRIWLGEYKWNISSPWTFVECFSGSWFI